MRSILYEKRQKQLDKIKRTEAEKLREQQRIEEEKLREQQRLEEEIKRRLLRREKRLALTRKIFPFLKK